MTAPWEDGEEYDPDRAVEEREERMREAAKSQPRTMRHEDFVYVAAEDLFRNVHTLIPYPANGVDARVVPWRVEQQQQANGNVREVPVKPSKDIMRDPAKVVDAVTWYPVPDKIIEGLSITATGEVRQIADNRLLNLYVPPVRKLGTVAGAAPWLDLGSRLFPDAAIKHRLHQILRYKMENPEKKVNCGILIAGNRRVGKDMWIDAFLKALGAGNVQTINPKDVTSQYTPWYQCVALKVNEMEPGHEQKAWEMIKELKPLCAAPPEALFVNEKHIKRYGIPNIVLVFAMTNSLKSIYMEDDRGRWFVIDCYHLPMLWYEKTDPDYFIKYKAWMDAGGYNDVAAYLQTVDMTGFNPGHPTIQTQALEELIQMSNEAPDDNLETAFDALGYPDVIMSTEILDHFEAAGNERATNEIRDFFKSRALMFRSEKSGYRVVHKERNDIEKENRDKPRFQFKVPGMASPLKASFAFVRQRVARVDEQAAIMERGKQWAAKRSGRVTSTGGAVPTDNGSGTVVKFPSDKF